ncbi:MAG: energy-coupling factor transporter transmembrane protein EcfT [archaeon GB-1867-005]|nr:energy-coupling factor transporter transmembrane protein EcfT [Candidatus Culexmicrobium cathedralense]
MRILAGFEFKRGDTFIHRLDPRVKLAYSIAIFTLAMIFTHTVTLSVLFLSSLPLFYIAKAVRKFLKTLQGSLFLVGIVFVVNFITLGFERALAMSIRLLLIISCFSIFFLTTYPEDFAEALVKLKIPYEFALTFTMALRFVPTLAREAQLIMDAQRSRGLELEKGSFLRRLRNFIPILVPLIVGAIRKSIRVAEAMESRAFGASPKRTSLRELKLERRDYAFLALVIIMFVAAIYAKYFLAIEELISTFLRFG